jgi:hypothetical protein
MPIGKTAVDFGSVALSIDGKSIAPDVVNDSQGGNWISVPLSGLSPESQIRISLNKVAHAGPYMNREEIARWLSASRYIDAGNDEIEIKGTSKNCRLKTKSPFLQVSDRF